MAVVKVRGGGLGSRLGEGVVISRVVTESGSLFRGSSGGKGEGSS